MKQNEIEAVPTLLGCRDYRRYLAAWFEWKKSRSHGFSGAVFARLAGLQSHTLLGMVIRGERNLSAHSTRAFARGMGLKKREAKYFEKLVQFNQARTSEDKSYFLDELANLLQPNGRSTGELARIRDHAAYLSRWWVVAVRELIPHPEFRANPEWISQRFRGRVTKAQAEEALKLLRELDLVTVDADTGRWKLRDQAIDVEPGTVDFSVRKFHSDMLALGREMIEGAPMEERELSTLLLAVDEEDVPRLRERIRDFRKQLNLEFSSAGKKKSRVMAVNSQVLVLSEP